MTETVTISRSDAIDAAGACAVTAYGDRRIAKRRARTHPPEHVADLLKIADNYDAVAHRIQRAADDAIIADDRTRRALAASDEDETVEISRALAIAAENAFRALGYPDAAEQLRQAIDDADDVR